MKHSIKCIVLLLVMSALCGCGVKESIHRTEEGLYSYNDLLYKNDGEIFLSENELEYVQLIAEFPEGVKGAEWYTRVSQYENWLLLELEENRCLQGLEGHRYFLLIPNTDKGREENVMAAGVRPYIYYNGTQYQYEDSVVSEDVADDMEVLGFIQVFCEGIQNQMHDDTFQTNSATLMGHLAYRNGEKILVSTDGGETYIAFSL